MDIHFGHLKILWGIFVLPVSAAELDGLLLDDHLPAVLLRLLLRQGVPVRRLAQFVEPPD